MHDDQSSDLGHHAPSRYRGWITPALQKACDVAACIDDWILGSRSKYQGGKIPLDLAHRRALRVDTMIAVCVLIDAGGYAVAYTRVPYARVLATVFAAWRIVDILVVAARVSLFDRFNVPKGKQPVVASHVRVIVLGLVNYAELWVCFATVYTALQGSYSKAEFPRDWFDPLYFSAMTQLTIGYGDIAPEGLARAVAVGHGFGALLLLLLVVGRFISLLRQEVSLDDGQSKVD